MAATLTCSFVLLLFVMIILIYNPTSSQVSTRNFTIDYDHNTFLKDGKPFRYISGSIHYSRIPMDYWMDRLLKMYAAGLNAIQNCKVVDRNVDVSSDFFNAYEMGIRYIPWNIHQKEMGTEYDFTGQQDLVQFIKTAQHVGLLVILRPGPYICAEWDFGGLPAWILKENPKTVLRSMDPTYIKYVDQWFDILMPKVKPLLYVNGGPIIAVQIENEYGAYFTCDHTYTEHLRDKVISHLGNDVVLFTTDNAIDPFIRCGKIPGVYTTIDFGITDFEKPSDKFKHQRKFQPKGPLVNSEFYTGWLDHWGSKHQVRSMATVAKDLDELLQVGANVNMYMFEGGTNFGYWNGANYYVYPFFEPIPTSYDYDAPLSEAGDITPKYNTLRQVISKYNKLPDIPIPPSTPKAKYGTVKMEFVGTVQDLLPQLSSPGGMVKSKYPLTMEAIGQLQGFALYRHILKNNVTSTKLLSIPGIRDRGYVTLDKELLGIVVREKDAFLSIEKAIQGQVLDILVENQGHINYGSELMKNSKGLIENVTLGGQLLEDWTIYPISPEKFRPSAVRLSQRRPKVIENVKLPSVYIGNFNITGNSEDTYLDMTGWTKGQAILEGQINLGRYWPTAGPQVRMYVPKPYLKGSSQSNTLIMFELESAPCETGSHCSVTFVDKPFINGTSASFLKTP